MILFILLYIYWRGKPYRTFKLWCKWRKCCFTSLSFIQVKVEVLFEMILFHPPNTFLFLPFLSQTLFLTARFRQCIGFISLKHEIKHFIFFCMALSEAVVNFYAAGLTGFHCISVLGGHGCARLLQVLVLMRRCLRWGRLRGRRFGLCTRVRLWPAVKRTRLWSIREMSGFVILEVWWKYKSMQHKHKWGMSDVAHLVSGRGNCFCFLFLDLDARHRSRVEGLQKSSAFHR